jgi:hypothetical protein
LGGLYAEIAQGAHFFHHLPGKARFLIDFGGNGAQFIYAKRPDASAQHAMLGGYKGFAHKKTYLCSCGPQATARPQARVITRFGMGCK